MGHILSPLSSLFLPPPTSLLHTSEEGIMKQFRWNGRIYTTFSTRHNIHYMTLAELYDHFLQPKGVTKVNMTYRMRKLNLRTIRSSSWVRLRMIILGSHSPHIPVCCLLQMEDCVKLLKCFHIQLPSILKKVFLIGNKKIYKHKVCCTLSLSLSLPLYHWWCSFCSILDFELLYGVEQCSVF